MPSGVYTRTKQHRRSISDALIKSYQTGTRIPRWLNKKQPIEVRNKNRLAHLGKKTLEDNPMWKGEKAGYTAKHQWINRQLGQPSECENCIITLSKKLEWANISGEYKRDISDWARLCSICHHLFDNQGLKSSNTKRLKGSLT